MHRSAFDNTCQACHTVEDPGGTSDKSFCSNSICHGSYLKYVGLDAPKVREIIKAQMPLPTPTLVPSATPVGPKPTTAPAGQATQAANNGPVTFVKIGPILEAKCKTCHGDTGIKGLSLTSYANVMAGGSSGPAVVAGKPDDSLLVQKQVGGNHPGQLSPEELDLVKQWISAGAPEK